MPADSSLLSAADAAAILGLNERTIRRAIQRGELPAIRQGRAFGIRPSDLERFGVLAVSRTRDQAAAGAGTGESEALAPIVGREQEIAQLLQLARLSEQRIISIVGPGGVGKTRLALAVAETLGPEFADGSVFVDLAPVTGVADVPLAIATATSIYPGTRQASDVLLAIAGERSWLLVLDNFEQLIDAASFVEALAAAWPGSVVLTTSRVPLDLTAEEIFELAPLGTPPVGSTSTTELRRSPASVRLFVQQVRAFNSAYQLDDDNAPTISEIVRRLDGLPLGIRLAASRARSMPLPQLIEQLERRLPVLIGGNRSDPLRHQTLGTVVGWSYDLLSPGEQEAFRRLAVPPGGFDADLAAALLADSTEAGQPPPERVEHILASLCAKNLIVRTGAGRFSMLETMRGFGLDQLEASGEAVQARRAVGQYFANLIDRFDREYAAIDQAAWYLRLSVELNTIREVARRAIARRDAELAALVVAPAFAWLLTNQGFMVEGLQWAEQVLALEEHGAPASVIARAHFTAGWFSRFVAGNDLALGHFRRALDLLEPATDPDLEVLATEQLGEVLLDLGDLDAAREVQQRTLQVARETGQPSLVAVALNGLAMAEVCLGNLEIGRQLLSEGLALIDSGSDHFRRAVLHSNMGYLLVSMGEYHRAGAEFRQSCDLLRVNREQSMINIALANLGDTLILLGDLDRAEEALAEAADGVRRSGNLRNLPVVMASQATISAKRGHLEQALQALQEALRLVISQEQLGQQAAVWMIAGIAVAGAGRLAPAVSLFAAADAFQQEAGSIIEPHVVHERDEALARARRQLSRTDFRAAWERGKSMRTEGVLAVAAIQSAVEQEHFDRPSRDGSDHGLQSLSSREREVLQLLAEGLSDQQIADQLFLSKRTVSTHVANIRAKLGVDSRTAAASVAIRRGLIA
jgi:excisionase family DNA binding protein